MDLGEGAWAASVQACLIQPFAYFLFFIFLLVFRQVNVTEETMLTNLT